MSHDDLTREEGTVFYCQVDSYRATKDYLQNGRCVRFLAVRETEFSADVFGDGITTLTIDIDFWLYCQHKTRVGDWRQVDWTVPKQIEQQDDVLRDGAEWFRLEVAYCVRSPNYLYRTFSRQLPQYFDIVSLDMHVGGLRLQPPPVARFIPMQSAAPFTASPFSQSSDKPYRFDTFHVGQGMCSLVHDGVNGVLLDVGAGKPITRLDYLNGKIRTNELATAVRRLKLVWLVISHADSDHWRVMAWDAQLLTKISRIFAPSGAISVAMQDKAVLKKIEGLNDVTWQLSENTALQIWRSAPPPSKSDANGECLVAVFERNDKRGLAPGDYVYERFIVDTNPGINSLHRNDYAAVVVPHHGDAASANSLVRPSSNAKAFFSAGTHQSWNHPTLVSTNAHKVGKFTVISDREQTDILRVNLI